MKKLLFILLSLCELTAQGQLSRPAAEHKIDSLLPSNQSRIITPERLKKAFGAVMDFAATSDTTGPKKVVGELDVVSGKMSLTIGGDNGTNIRTDGQTKYGRIVVAPWEKTRLPTGLFTGYSYSTYSSMYVGGGAPNVNTVQFIQEYTAPTLGAAGVIRRVVNSDGSHWFGANPLMDGFNLATFNGNVNVKGKLTTQQIEPDGFGTRNNGSASFPWLEVWAARYLSSSSLLATFGTAVVGSDIHIRQGSGSQIIAGWHKTTGNYFVGAPGLAPADNGHRFQLNGSQRITGDLVHSSTSNVYNYNSASEDVNWERVKMGWSGNVFSIAPEANGTGINREIRIGSNNSFFGLVNGVSPNSYRYISASNQHGFHIRADIINNSGISNALVVSPSVSQTLTGGYRGILVSPYESSVGSSPKILLDLGTNTAANASGTHNSVFSVANNGDLVTAGGASIGGSVIPGTDNTFNIGSSASRYDALFFSNILFGNASRAFNIAQTAKNTNTVFRIHPTTGNVVIQTPGAVPADRGFTLDVLGNQAITGTLTLNDGVLTKNTAGSWNFGSASVAGITNLSSSNLVLGSSLATGVSGVFGRTATFAVPSAALEVESTTKGLLPPRMTEAQKNAIPSPAEGLLVYQNSGVKGWYGFDGSAWVKLN